MRLDSKEVSPDLVSHGQSSPGLWRQENEDSFGCYSHFFIVADGLGGHQAGEKASHSAVCDLAKKVQKLQIASAEEMCSLIDETAKNLYKESLLDAKLNGMATTVASLLFTHESFIASHAGDSRIYLLRDGELKQLTQDDAYEIEVDPSELAPVRKRYLTKAVGLKPRCQPQTLQGAIQEGDCFLLCTDGLSDYVTQTEMKFLIEKNHAPKEATEKLIQAALNRGGRDNITAIVVRVLRLSV